MKRVFPFIILLIALSVHGQDKKSPEFKKYDWVKEPVIHELSPEEQKEGTVLLRDMRMMEYIYDKDENLVMYLTRHMIIRLNNDKSIEENNKVYIPVNDVFEVVDLRARTITKSGKVKMVEKENIKDVENLENMGPFRIFAFEGVEIGSEVEYIYTLMKIPGIFGTETLQSEVIKKQLEVTIVSPENLKFSSKLYNSSQESKTGEEDGKNFIRVKFDNIPALKEERYAAYRANLIRMEYKLSKNLNKGSQELFPFSDAATRVWEDMTDLSGQAKKESEVKSNIKKSKKVIKKCLDTMKIPKDMKQEDKIRLVESRMKTRIQIKEDAPAQTMVQVLNNNYCNPKDMMRLLAESYTQLGIRYEMVLTTDRFKTFFDGNYETWNYLDNYLFYFPEVDNYMAPGEMFSRLGQPPNEWMCNDGLFVKGVKLDDKVTGYGKVKSIKCPEHKLSYDNIYAEISFEEDFTSTHVHLKRTLSGFSTGGLQSFFAYLPENNKTETTDAFLKMLGEDSKLSAVKIQNLDEKSAGKEPVIMEADVITSNLLEKAGTKYIFKVGDVIGPQAELYQEEKRRLPVENEYNRGYYREITFTIPDGYKASNLDALNMNVSCMVDGKVSAEFVSNYSVHNNVVKVVIEENYRDIRLPVEQFEPFRKVINAAADFNKITIFLEKK